MQALTRSISYIWPQHKQEKKKKSVSFLDNSCQTCKLQMIWETSLPSWDQWEQFRIISSILKG